VQPPLHHSDRRKSTEKTQKAAEEKQKPDYDDGLIKITFVHTRGEAILIASQKQPEREPQFYTSDQIDRGDIPGMIFHPVNGMYMEKDKLRFDEKSGCFVVPNRESFGWMVGGEGKSKILPRIGDGNDHWDTDFPLPHWDFARKAQEGH
jgi:hypothetical protein